MIDKVMSLLAERLGMEEIPKEEEPNKEIGRLVYNDLPFDASGRLDQASSMALNLTPGAELEITTGPASDGPNKGAFAIALGQDQWVHYKVATRDPSSGWLHVWMLGSCWPIEASQGAVDALPVVPSTFPSPSIHRPKDMAEEAAWIVQRSCSRRRRPPLPESRESRP